MKKEMNDIIDVFVPNPTENGLLIMIKEDLKTYKYIGKNNSITLRFKPLPMNKGHKTLNELTLFKSDKDNIIDLINEYRQKGINARILSVFRYEGETCIDYDYTDDYIDLGMITKLN
ncbi:hypothetical protein [Alkaliphilus sp. B6464]|uniref:hypothetical protein n=1 Tax=Alkaliphilus sp. B6464 TaxID=2731219 RepID=UPI001BA879FD|nr:hypothetical protein [Alkaliphilus sp. B6464]QUH21744.1 hypothetical protein HYG84_17565 [Alkaliphilus sp. B6464]